MKIDDDIIMTIRRLLRLRVLALVALLLIVLYSYQIRVLYSSTFKDDDPIDAFLSFVVLNKFLLYKLYKVKLRRLLFLYSTTAS
jgi:hypothetical protein